MSGPPVEAIDARGATANAGGWQARLELQFEAAEARTRLAHRRHHGPLLIQRVFYPEPPLDAGALAAEPCHVYVLHPPGGVVSGDELQLEVDVQAQAHALLTTPAAGKFYRRSRHSAGEQGGSDARVARLTQPLPVDGGILEWLPQENIYFPETAVQLRTLVRLQAGARFIGWEIGWLGVPASEASLGGCTGRHLVE